MPMPSRSLLWCGSMLAVFAALALGGAYLAVPDFFRPPTVTAATSILAPVSEAIYGTGTVEPERWAKVVPLQRRRLLELCRCEGQAASMIGHSLDTIPLLASIAETAVGSDQAEGSLSFVAADGSR